MKRDNVCMWHGADQVHFIWSQTKVKHYWFNKVIEELFRCPNQYEISENTARELDFHHVFLLFLWNLLTFWMCQKFWWEKVFSFHCMFCSLLMCMCVCFVYIVKHLNGRNTIVENFVWVTAVDNSWQEHLWAVFHPFYQ